MTVFEKVTQSPDMLAAFMTGLISGTEERMLAKLDEYGIQASIVTPSDDVRTLDNLAMLLEEVDDGDT
jgi:hypothetical protein